VLGAALLALVCGLAGVTPFGGGASGPQSVDTASLDGLSVLPGLGESVLTFGSPLDEQVAEAPPFGDALELNAGSGGPIGRLAWAGPGEIVPAQFPNVALPGGIEPDFGEAGDQPLSDAPFAAFGESAEGFAGFSSGTLGSFLGAGSGAGNPNGPLPLPGTGGDPPPGSDPPVPEPSPVDLLQIALALLAGLAYRRFRA
jgi:hypothetical protein